MERGCIFQPRKINSSLRNQVYDKDDDDRKVQSGLETTKSRDFSLGKPYLGQYFDDLLTYNSSADTEAYDGMIMTEVFRVIINIEGGGGYLSGKIYFSTFNVHKYLYKQGKCGQYVEGGCDLLTTVIGPDHVIPSFDNVLCFVDLMLSDSECQPLLNNCEIIPQLKQDRCNGRFDYQGNFYDRNGILCDFVEQRLPVILPDDTDDELDEYERRGCFTRISNCKGRFSKIGMLKERKKKLDGLLSRRRIFDKALRYKVNSNDGKCSVTILYAFFHEAVQANVEVILKDDESEFGVYGLVAARNDMIREDDYEIILFLKEDLSRSVPAVSGRPIPLSRSLVAVPINSNLLVRADLRTKDKHFPSARLIFPAQQSGISELPINDKMQVKVTWKPRQSSY